MIEAADGIGREAFLADFSGLIQRRIFEAQPVQLLSSSDDKRVELVEDVTGDHFVRRTYSQDALDWIGQSGLDFEDALNAMQGDFARAGLSVVPSFVVNPERQKGQPLVVVSQYLEGAQSVNTASTEAKGKLAAGLGNLLVRSENVLPQQQMLRADMFHAVQTPDGEESIVLTDIDPYVVLRSALDRNPAYRDTTSAAYINRIASLLYDEWCNDSEREAVLGRLLGALGSIFGGDPGMSTMKAFGDVNLMKQGLDPRHF